jgi:23S rRNA (adenine2030-N6)-methyltransferase
MNYRHAYHAGNFADCMKHALLILLLRAMQAKTKPLLVLDTHAGTGRYDLAGEAATRTGEWRDGIARLLAARPPALADYLSIIDGSGLYPGSPAIAAAWLRPTDRLIACELHPADAATLRRNFVGHAQVAVHQRDGYEALRAFLPPPERRALILIDPPYEATDEFTVLANALIKAHAKFPSGVFCAWFPVKHVAPVRGFHDTLRAAGLRDIVAATFMRRPPTDPTRLNGCGLTIINPPFGFGSAATPILNTLVALLGEPGASAGVETIADE